MTLPRITSSQATLSGSASRSPGIGPVPFTYSDQS
jgi:hypothetical protein